ncbi:MAG: aminopeptidase P family protein [Actinomycetota bacterium]|nr:aminopeptidase P family protein [Actinomycetota bacterium]
MNGGTPFAARLERARLAMSVAGVDALLISLGADLPWLTGYSAMPLERLTMLVVPAAAGGQATLVVPELEAPRVVPIPEVFSLRPWSETEDPVEIVASLVRKETGPSPALAVGDQTWARFVLGLQAALPSATWRPACSVTGPLRAVKDAAEIEALARAAASADKVAAALLGGEIPLAGRTEREVSAEISRHLLEEGHEHVNFAIVASGPNAASPHHEASDRRIGKGEPVVCDFGGSLSGYCSDTTRTVFTGPPPAELAHIYEVVAGAQAAGVEAAQLGRPCSEVDRAARTVIEDAGYGRYFVHRTGHGIGLEEHEDPYMVAGNDEPLAAGHVFSVEPGIYVPGKWGVRIEDIVAATAAGPEPLNKSSRALTVVPS